MKKPLLLFSLLLSLAACNVVTNNTMYVYGDLNTSFTPQNGAGYQSLESRDFPHAGKDISSVYSKMYNESHRYCLPSIGEQKFLVIPVDFEDSVGSLQDLNDIRRVFFGQMQRNEMPSVAEYYDLSSYGRLQVKGKVASSYYRSKKTIQELSSISGSRKTKAALQEIYADALKWYDETHVDDPSASYACTYQGRTFVPVFFVYRAPYQVKKVSNRSSMLWAFTINDPAPISWVSLDMLRSDSGLDTHTCIHETGHLFGIPDYYDTQGQENLSSPLGRIDMMDCSLGDHNPFTKFMLGWVKPMIPTGEGEVTLRPFADTGDCLLIPSPSFNKSLYDQYLLLIYYTPGSLNYFDAILRDNDAFCMPNASGVLAYQVDARLGYFQTNNSIPRGFVEESTNIDGFSVFFYHDNSGGTLNEGRVKGDHLLQLIDGSSDSQDLIPNFVGSSEEKAEEGSTLRNVFFTKGMGMDEGDFRNFRFHPQSMSQNTETISYAWKVKDLSMARASVSFRKRLS